MTTLSRAIELMQNSISAIFDFERLDTLAKSSGFIQRKNNRIEAIDFVQLMTVEILQNPDISLDGLCDILASLNPKSQMSAQALQQRINTPDAADFLSTIFCECLTDAVTPLFAMMQSQLLTPFQRILIQDSTTITLDEKLAVPFRGCGGSGAKSALKLHAVYDLQHHQFTMVNVTNGATPETLLGQALVDIIQGSDLLIRDLGYFSIEQLKQIEQKDAYFLSRLPKSCGVYLSEESDAKVVEIFRYLDKYYPHGAVVSLDVYLGKDKFPCRLVAYRLPESVVNERRRKAYQAAHKKSRKPTKEYLSWLRFSFYITNVPLNVWATEVIGTIYRIRWQIELMFKQWKSLLRIDCLRGTSPYRIESLIYGRLCVVCIISMLYGTLFWYAWETDLGEVSQEKMIKWLLRKNRFAQLIRHCSLFRLFDELLSVLSKRLLKQKRKRKTTLERICDHETFEQVFPQADEILKKAA
jgi:hypothetical protein